MPSFPFYRPLGLGFAALLPALLPVLLPTAAHAAGDAGSCRYVPVAKMTVDYADSTRRISTDGAFNGKPVRILLDTGAFQTKMMLRTAERLGLAPTSVGSYTYGVGGAAVNYVTHVNDFSMGDFHTGKTLVPVIDIPNMDKGIDAIVGADFLLQTDMELSLADKTMQFFRASGCADTYLAYWDSDAMEIPFIGKEEKTNKPIVAVELNGVRLNAILDTGATRTSVTKRAAALAGVSIDGPGVRRSGTSGGIGDKTLDSWTADFKRFGIGPETINNPQLSIIEDAPQGESRIDMLLGIDFLRAHRILFAMSQDRLYMSYLGAPLFGATQQAPAAGPPPKAP